MNRYDSVRSFDRPIATGRMDAELATGLRARPAARSMGILGPAILAAGLLAAGSAEAGKGRHHAPPFRAGHASTVEYARVVHVRPLVEHVQVHVPVQECYETWASDGGHGRRSTVVPTIAGGVIGGVIGDRFGGGSGRDAMRMLGVLVGASIAHDAAGHRRSRAASAYPVTECSTRHERRYEERVIGYDVTYRHRGREYVTRTDRHPGDRIPVSVDVRPAW